MKDILESSKYTRNIGYIITEAAPEEPTKTEIVDGARDYRLMTRSFVDALVSMSEYNRFSKGMFGWVGFKTKYLPYKNVQRVAGTTDWSTWKLFKYAVDGITDFSEAPLSIATWIGGVSAFLSK